MPKLDLAIRFLASRGVYGLVLLDEDLRAIERFGSLVDHVTLGQPIASSVLAFVGYEDDIRALRHAPDQMTSLPNVKMQAAGGQAGRVNLVVYRLPDQPLYLLVVSSAGTRSDLEHAYLAESRMRQMAEAEVAAQAVLIQRANDELAMANRDLQEFASVISHDLRAPLRGLRYAASDAQAALTSGEPEVAAENLAKVIDRSRRMGAMLTGLLDYTRAGRKTDVVGPLDTRALAEEIAESTGEGRDFEIVVEGDWPTIDTLAEPLDIVLRNLVDNAVKHHDRCRGRVVVRCADGGSMLEMSVSDDGPGIDPAWHAAIFEPFKQVMDADQADGAGIGLALVKKTVERFGGSIHVQSDPARSRGATLHVAWPKVIPL